ncbi:MAG: hypothetical protein Q8O26_02500 [Phreatobacter sp.]|uniref:hypothetical protein n=1 Tax=Phreatobacter sp. TaxID=1966341 RepID=UPI0027363DAF|nr:hypothetical protein [Phreatobacter sp.]MDP2800729.1 hypothetical protein [Phreatobacter sp.]
MTAQNEGTENRSRLEARRSLRETEIMANVFLGVGIAVGVAVLFVDWRISPLPVLLGGVFYVAVHMGAPPSGRDNPLIFAIDRQGIQIGGSTPIPWNAISAVKLQSKIDALSGAYLVIEFSDEEIFTAQASAWDRIERVILGRKSISVHLVQLDVGPDDIRNIVRQYQPGLLGSENPLFRA